jgi:hypothetical protein
MHTLAVLIVTFSLVTAVFGTVLGVQGAIMLVFGMLNNDWETVQDYSVRVCLSAILVGLCTLSALYFGGWIQ